MKSVAVCSKFTGGMIELAVDRLGDEKEVISLVPFPFDGWRDILGSSAGTNITG